MALNYNYCEKCPRYIMLIFITNFAHYIAPSHKNFFKKSHFSQTSTTNRQRLLLILPKNQINQCFMAFDK